MRLQFWLWLPCLTFISFATCQNTDPVNAESQVVQFFTSHEHQHDEAGMSSTSAHTNNWAVLVCASRYWFNYRHMANALGMYRTVKRLGIPDSNIILMLADDVACNARNPFPGCVFPDRGRHIDLYGDNIEVDYRGYEVTVENFLRVLTGRVDPQLPPSKRLLSTDRSNVLVFLTGHGGAEFLKFQDNEEVSAFDLADAFAQMHAKRRYNELLLIVDTCQANSMYSKLYSPGIIATGSSQLGENSYSYESDNDVGVAVIDSYTHHVLAFMEGINKTSRTSLQDLFDTYDPAIIHSQPGVRTDLFNRSLHSARITDFFGGVSQAEVLPPLPASLLDLRDLDHDDDDMAVDEDAASQRLDGEAWRRGVQGVTTLQELSLGVESEGSKGRSAGAWAAIAIIGGLVGWVTRKGFAGRVYR